MNLKDSRTRRMLIAFGATATVVAGGATAGVVAASATTTLSVTPSTTAVTMLNLGAGGAVSEVATQWNMDQDLSDATYAMRVTTSTTTLKFELDSAPSTSAKFFYGQTAATGTTGPAAVATDTDTDGTVDTGNWLWLTTLTAGTTDVTAALTAGQNFYVTADVPGTYTGHFVDTMNTPGDDDDATSSTITFTVKDVENNTSSDSSDDWAPSVSVPSTISTGAPLTATVPMSTLTLTDARGSASSVPYLGDNLSDLIGVGFAGASYLTADDTAGTGVDYGTSTSTTAGSRSVAVSTSAATGISGTGTLTTTAYFDRNADGTINNSFSTATTTVSSNGVSAVTLDATDVEGSVKETSGAVAVKAGQGAVTYTATVTDSDTDKSGNVVYFDLGGTNAATVTTDGTTVDAANYIYSATTNSSGVATLVATSSVTTAATTYTVTAVSNGYAAGTTMTATYAAAAATTLAITNTEAQLAPTVGDSVTITGTLKDQFGALYQPTAAEGSQVTITMGAAPTTIYGTISAGAYSAVYTPTTTPTAGATTSISVGYTPAGGSALTAATGTLSWTSASSPASITLTAPAASFTPTTQVAGSAIATATTVTGTVYDSSSTALAYKSVTLSGAEGVYFSTSATPDATHPLTTSLTTTSNSSGVITAYAYFTKAGATSITATSGSVTASVSGTASTALAGSAYTVTVDDVSTVPGDSVTVSGTTADAFGNPVPGVVNLSLGSSTLGTLSASSATANSLGIWTATFTTGSNAADGTATLTGTLNGLSADPTANAGWATAGLTVATGDYQDAGTITVAEETVSLNAPESRTGSGTVSLTGTTAAGLTVKIYGKNKGSDDAFALLGTAVADDEGAWSKSLTLSRSKTFIASINGDDTYSDEDTTTVVSKVTIDQSKAKGKKRVTITADGNPNVEGTAKIYVKHEGHWDLLATVTTDDDGNFTKTVKAPSKGTKTFKVTFKAPGTDTGSATVSTKVK